MRNEKQPPYPHLFDCKFGGDSCARYGCFFANVKERIQESHASQEDREQALAEADHAARQKGCKQLG